MLRVIEMKKKQNKKLIMISYKVMIISICYLVKFFRTSIL